MGIVATIKRCLYQILVRSHILYYLLPVIMKIVLKLVMNPKQNSNYQSTDKKGKTINFYKFNGRIYPAFGPKQIQQVPNLTVRDSDVLLCGYPKTGCHWTFEILHMLVNGVAEISKHGKGPAGMLEAIPEVLLDSVPSPRVLNTHYLFEELPIQAKAKGTKIVLTARNPKDSVVSYFHHVKSLNNMYQYDGDFDGLFELCMSGDFEYGSYFDYMLSWDEHIRNPTTNDILLVTFEEMKEQPVQTVKKIAKFINVAVTDQFAQDVVDAADINKLRQARKEQGNPTEKLIRTGKVGGWKSMLTDDQSAAIDRVWQQRMTGITYQPKYDL